MLTENKSVMKTNQIKTNVIHSLLFYCFIFNAIAQETFYRASPNVVNADGNAGTIQVELNYQISTIQAQFIYNVTSAYFLFGAYNVDDSNNTYRTLIFRDKRTLEKNNSGFNVGAGIQNFGTIGRYENLELLLGFEQQKVNNIEFFTDSQSSRRDNLMQEYYKIFTQFNIMKNRTNFDFGYSVKASYLKFTKIEFNTNTDVFQGRSLIFLDPTVNFNYKFLSNKNLMISSQVGLSLPLGSLKETSVSNDNSVAISKSYLAGPIFKVGIQYRFNLR